MMLLAVGRRYRRGFGGQAAGRAIGRPREKQRRGGSGRLHCFHVEARLGRVSGAGGLLASGPVAMRSTHAAADPSQIHKRTATPGPHANRRPETATVNPRPSSQGPLSMPSGVSLSSKGLAPALLLPKLPPHPQYK